MLVTVQEAKSRICPMGMEDGEGQSTCYGPECMGWRWLDPTTVWEDRRRGYCGVGGMPEVGM